MMPTSGELLACTCVSGGHVAYVPLYIMSLLRAYPDAAARILVDTLPLPAETAAALDIVRGEVSDRFEVAAWADRGLPRGDGRVAFVMALRFVLGREHYAGFRYGLTTDVDTLIIAERPALAAQEAARARVLGMPYSNMTHGPYHSDPTGRLTTWHFIVVEPYFKKMQPIVERARRRMADDPAGFDAGLPPTSYDEHMLYCMVREGLGIHETSATRPFPFALHHGFHLGNYTHGGDAPWSEWWRDNNAWRHQALGLLTDPAFVRILALTPSWIRAEVESLAAFMALPPLHPYEPAPAPEPL